MTTNEDRLRIAEEHANAKSIENDSLRQEIVVLRSALAASYQAFNEATLGDPFTGNINDLMAWVDSILGSEGSGL